MLEVRPHVHAGAVPPDEEGLVVRDSLFHQFQRPGGDFLVNSLHALFGQRAGILDLAAREAVNYAAGCKILGECRVIGVVGWKPLDNQEAP